MSDELLTAFSAQHPGTCSPRLNAQAQLPPTAALPAARNQRLLAADIFPFAASKAARPEDAAAGADPSKRKAGRHAERYSGRPDRCLGMNSIASLIAFRTGMIGVIKLSLSFLRSSVLSGEYTFT